MRPFSLLGLGVALALSGLAGQGNAQCSTAGGAVRYSSAEGLSISRTSSLAASTLSVSQSGAVASICVDLNGVTSSGQGGSQSMLFAAFLLTAPGATNSFVLLSATGDGIDGDDAGDSGSGLAEVNIAISDSGAIKAPCGNPTSCTGSSFGIWPHSGSVSVQPGSYWMGAHGGASPPVGAPGNWPQSDGIATFAGAMNGAAANGAWTLTLIDEQGDAISVASWDIVITTVAPAGTATSLSSSLNPSFTSAPNGAVTLTAAVTADSGAPTGTVAFTDNGAGISGCGGAILVASGTTSVALCTTTFSSEGNHPIQASYTPSGGFAPSASSTLSQFVKNHSTLNAGQYCNSGAISFPAPGAAGPMTPYPSVINIGTDTAGLANTVEKVSITLNGLTSSSGLEGSQFLLVGPDGIHNLEFLSGSGSAGGAQPTATVTFADGGSTSAPGSSVFLSGTTYEATDRNINAAGDDVFTPPAPFAPPVPAFINHAQPDGSTTLTGAFNGASGNGDWSLFVNGNGQAMLSGGWCLDFALNTGAATATGISASANPAILGESVTITATVKSGGTPVTTGTVTFTDGTSGAAPSGIAANTLALDSNGQAAITTSSLAEGDHKIAAIFNGTGAFNLSSAVLYQRVDSATTVQPPNGSQVQFCNTAPILLPSGTGAATPNPSNILVTTLPGSVNTVSLQLENFEVQQNGQAKAIASLLVGPVGANLNFFSGTGDTAETNNTSLAQGLYSFADSATGLAPESQFGPGSYQPSDYDPSDTFTQSPSNFETLPGLPYNLAAPAASATFRSAFANTNGNAIWSLYFNQSGNADAVSGAANGWCLTFSVNPPELAAAQVPSGMQVTQGSSAAVKVIVQNPVGPGSAGGAIPVTVSDTFPAGFTPTGGNGPGWNCSAPSGQTIRCTSTEFIAPGTDFDTLALAFSVPGDANPGVFSNTAVVSGSGLVAGIFSNPLSITILPAAILAVATTPVGTFTQGETAEWDVSIANAAPAGSTTVGTTTLVDTLPSGYTLSSYSSVPASPAWTCGSIANVVTCTSTQAVGGGASFSKVQLSVEVPENSPASVTNNVVAFGGGDVIHTSTATGSSASATATNVGQVAAAPTIAVAFGSAIAGLGGTVGLTVTIHNPNPSASLTGINFTDNLPAGLTVASTPTPVNNCGGVMGVLVGSPSILLTNGALGAGASCTISVGLLASAPGTENNTTGQISANESGPGAASNTASLRVIQPPTVVATFGAPSVLLNGTIPLTFTFTNPASATEFINIGVTDPLPSGLAVANPGGASGTCLTNAGATVIASPGDVSIAIAALSLAPLSSCSVSVNVTPASAGTKSDTTANLTASFDNGGGTLVGINGGTAAASLTVVGPPSISAAFASGLILIGDSTTLTFTIANAAANTVSLSGVGFVDALPAGLKVPNSTLGACDGGIVTTNPGTGITLSGGTIGVNGPCQFSITVTGAAAGSFLNTTGGITSANGGTGNTASAALSVETSGAASSTNSNIAMDPTAVSFTYSIGSPSAIQSQSVAVTASVPFTLTAAVGSGAPWLTATVSADNVTVTANAAGLEAGVYQGSVLLSISLEATPISLPVTFTVLGPPALAVSASSLAFTANQSSTGASPETQALLLSAQSGNVPFTFSTSASWLSVASSTTQTPATLQVTVTPATMPAATYNGSIQITAPGASNSPLTVSVVLRVVTATVTSSGIFENAASFLASPGAPNTIMAVYGNFTCPAKPSVLVNNSAVEVVGSTGSMVTFTLPPGVEGEDSIAVAVDCNGQQAGAGLLPLASVSPGIFTLSMTGIGQGAVVNQDGTVNGASHPAAVNTYLSIYGTGFGPYLAPSPDGLDRLSGTIQAFIAGKPAAIQFAGHAPDATSGLQQINVLIPADAPTGAAIPVELIVNGTSTQNGVTVAIGAQST